GMTAAVHRLADLDLLDRETSPRRLQDGEGGRHDLGADAIAAGNGDRCGFGGRRVHAGLRAIGSSGRRVGSLPGGGPAPGPDTRPPPRTWIVAAGEVPLPAGGAHGPRDSDGNGTGRDGRRWATAVGVGRAARRRGRSARTARPVAGGCGCPRKVVGGSSAAD